MAHMDPDMYADGNGLSPQQEGGKTTDTASPAVHPEPQAPAVPKGPSGGYADLGPDPEPSGRRVLDDKYVITF